MYNELLKKILLGSSVLLLNNFVACSDDPEENWTVVESAFEIDESDSLYSWYLEQMSRTPEGLSSNAVSSAAGKSSSSGGSDANSSGKVNSSSVEGSSSSGDKPASSSADVDSAYAEASKLRLLPPAGFYSELTIPVPAPVYGGVIRCTFNGAEPTVDAAEFTEPYVVQRNTVVRCAEFVGDSVARKSSHTFFINESVSMPVVSISVDPYLMFDPQAGYYSQGVRSCIEPCREANYWWDLELPVHVEFFDKGSASAKKDWQIDAGLSIIGQWSRYRAKKSVAIKMKSEYQDGRVKFPIFKTRPENDKFKAFNLRNNGNRFVGDYIEDPVLSSLLEGSGVDYQRSRQVVVFYNGGL